MPTGRRGGFPLRLQAAPKEAQEAQGSPSLYPAPGAHSRALAGSVVRVGLAIFCVKDELARPTLASA